MHSVNILYLIEEDGEGYPEGEGGRRDKAGDRRDHPAAGAGAGAAAGAPGAGAGAEGAGAGAAVEVPGADTGVQPAQRVLLQSKGGAGHTDDQGRGPKLQAMQLGYQMTS